VTDFDADAAALVRVVDELTDHQRTQGNMALELPPGAVLQLAALLQLLQRGSTPPATRMLVDAILLMVAEYFAGCPNVLAVLEAGAPPVYGVKTTH
jgi:hypothetical protein